MKATRRGVTLIECLLALIVMAIGLVGVLSLFPVAMETSKNSLEESHATMVAESIKHGLTAACKNAVFTTTSGNGHWEITLTHDLRSSAMGAVDRVNMALPPVSTATPREWRHYPGPDKYGELLAEDDAMFTDPTQADVFTMYADAWVKGHVDWVESNSRFTDPYNQFEFSINARKADKPAWITLTGGELERATTLYEFQIHVFRKRGSSRDLVGRSMKCQISVR